MFIFVVWCFLLSRAQHAPCRSKACKPCALPRHYHQAKHGAQNQYVVARAMVCIPIPACPNGQRRTEVRFVAVCLHCLTFGDKLSPSGVLHKMEYRDACSVVAGERRLHQGNRRSEPAESMGRGDLPACRRVKPCSLRPETS